MKKILFLTVVSLFFCSAAFAIPSLRDTSHRRDSIIIRDGSSFDRAIIIADSNESTGIAAEYKWLDDHYPGCKTGSQSLNYHNKKPYDILYIKTKDRESKEVYFDISNYFGKW
jgi:hypothetical protein